MPASTVKVVLRVKPSNDDGDDSMTIAGPDLIVKKGSGQDNLYQFHFDDILAPGEQKHVYETCAQSILEAAMEGYNGTILAYGQTGSGKTYTMSGWEGAEVTDPKYGGVLPRVIKQLFSMIRKKPECTAEVKMSYVEIYNETYRDLLQSKSQSGDITISDVKNQVSLKNVLTPEVKSIDETMKYLKEGQANRAVASHGMNEQSSRSHAVFTLWITTTNAEGQSFRSKLNLVDLAGSERMAKTAVVGERAKQSVHINKSLTFLEQVVVALSKKSAGHVPYRSSKLTHFLKDSLGGNCKTLMIACVWGDAAQISETISTCRFAQRMMKVKVDAKQNGVSMLGNGGLMRLDPVMQQYLEQMTAAAVAREKQRLYKEFAKRGKLPDGELEGLDGLEDGEREELEALRRKVAELEDIEATLKNSQNDGMVDEKTMLELEALRVRVLELEAERERGGDGTGPSEPHLDDIAAAELSLLRQRVADMEALQELSESEKSELQKLRERVAEMEEAAGSTAGISEEELQVLKQVKALRDRMAQLQAKPEEDLTPEEREELRQLRRQLLLLHGDAEGAAEAHAVEARTKVEAEALAGKDKAAAAATANLVADSTVPLSPDAGVVPAHDPYADDYADGQQDLQPFDLGRRPSDGGGADSVAASWALRGTPHSNPGELDHLKQLVNAQQAQIAMLNRQAEEQARHGRPPSTPQSALEGMDAGGVKSKPSFTKKLKNMFSRRRSKGEAEFLPPQAPVDDGMGNIVILNSLTHDQLMDLLQQQQLQGDAMAGTPMGGMPGSARSHGRSSSGGSFGGGVRVSLPPGLPPKRSASPRRSGAGGGTPTGARMLDSRYGIPGSARSAAGPEPFGRQPSPTPRRPPSAGSLR